MCMLWNVKQKMKSMKTLSRNSELKKHLRTGFPNENLWFYFGNNTQSLNGAKPQENFRNDFASVSQMNYRTNVSDNPVAAKRNEPGFIVDWQINSERV